MRWRGQRTVCRCRRLGIIDQWQVCSVREGNHRNVSGRGVQSGHRTARGKRRRRPQSAAEGPPAGFKTASTLWSSIHHAAIAAMKANAAHQKNGAL